MTADTTSYLYVDTSTSDSTSHYCIGGCNHTTTWSYPYWYTTIVYKYQVKCPKCKTFNWLELDKITPCSKCTSNLKAVALKADYEVEVG